jgi:hypothetical protein
VRRSGLPELISESPRSAADPEGSAGGVEKTPWSFWWKSTTVCAPGSEKAAITFSGTAQGITGQRARAAVGENEVGIWACEIEEQALGSIALRETAEQLTMAASSSALDGKRDPESRRSGVAGKFLAADGPSAISAFNGKSELGPLQLPMVAGILALNDKSEPGLRQLPMVEGISALRRINVETKSKLVDVTTKTC